MGEFTKQLANIKGELLNLKQGAKVVSTTTTYVHEETLTLPVDALAQFKSFRAQITYRDTGQPIFSTISVKNPNEEYYSTGQVAKTAVDSTGKQYFWIETLATTQTSRTREVVIIATAPILSVELALE